MDVVVPFFFSSVYARVSSEAIFQADLARAVFPLCVGFPYCMQPLGRRAAAIWRAGMRLLVRARDACGRREHTNGVGLRSTKGSFAGVLHTRGASNGFRRSPMSLCPNKADWVSLSLIEDRSTDLVDNGLEACCKVFDLSHIYIHIKR